MDIVVPKQDAPTKARERIRAHRLLPLLLFCWIAGLISAFAGTSGLGLSLMQSTFKIAGPAHDEPGENRAGTAFLLLPDDATSESGQVDMILVTATHVFKDIHGPKATIYLRKKISGAEYEKRPHKFRIRDENGQALWTSHPKADVSAIHVQLPCFVLEQRETFPGLNIDRLASDCTVKNLHLQPGDQLFCLGYPYGMDASGMGFPVLRSGIIASFPLTPAKQVETFLFDVEVFDGYSGGPVYYAGPAGARTPKSASCQETSEYITGLVSRQSIAIHKKKKTVRDAKNGDEVKEETETKERLSLAIVVPAQFIKETIDLLEQSEKPKEKAEPEEETEPETPQETKETDSIPWSD